MSTSTQIVSQGMASLMGKNIETGPQGGQFYRTPTGKKVYLKEPGVPKSPRRTVSKEIEMGTRGGR